MVEEEYYKNYKGSHCFNNFTVADFRHILHDVEPGFKGWSADKEDFEITQVGTGTCNPIGTNSNFSFPGALPLSEHQQLLVDDGLKGDQRLLPPSRCVTETEGRQQKANRIGIENVHSELKKSWQILDRPWQRKRANQPIYMASICKLHNYLLRLRQDRSLELFCDLFER